MRLLVQIPELSKLMAELSVVWADLLGPAYDIVGERTELVEECLWACLEQVHYQYFGIDPQIDIYFSPYYTHAEVDALYKLCVRFYYEHSGLYQTMQHHPHWSTLEHQIYGVLVKQTSRVMVVDVSGICGLWS